MKSHRPLARVLLLASTIAGISIIANGCDGGGEGDRCNPNLSHNDCGEGLTCMQPATCVESYCCPSDPSTSSNPFCNGQACPAVDGGAGEAGGDDSSTTTPDGGSG
jgi:hypothetical protein